MNIDPLPPDGRRLGSYERYLLAPALSTPHRGSSPYFFFVATSVPMALDLKLLHWPLRDPSAFTS